MSRATFFPRFLLPLVVTSLLVADPDPPCATASNQLANPGFESGSFSGWTVGGQAESGVAPDGTAISGTVLSDAEVNVHSGSDAAWAKLATFQTPPKNLTLSQTVTVSPYTLYEVSFWAGLGTTMSNAGRYATITVGGTTIFDDFYNGVIGTTSADYVQVKAYYNSGATSGPVTVTFDLVGSGSGLVGFSFDDFSFDEAGNLLTNPGFETCDFTGWTVGGQAESGVATDGTAISGTVFSDAEVNVHTGSCAAWGKLAKFQSPAKNLTLSQTVTVAPNTVYEASFWASLGTTMGNAGRFATITVGGTTVMNDQEYTGPNGTTPADYVQVKAYYSSGATSGPVTVTFDLVGSGSGLAGFSFDDFNFSVHGPSSLLAADDPPRAQQIELLGRARPNPFRGVTAIPYRVPAAGRVSLKVFDAAGRNVRTLVDGSRPPGSYTAGWEGADDRGVALAPGTYFLRLEAGGAVDRKSIVYLR